MPKTLYFDYDGTLHKSMELYYPAFLKMYDYLLEVGVCEERKWSKEEVEKWLGYNKVEMWDSFLAHLPDDIKRKADQIIGDEMIRLMNMGKAQLFLNVEHVLETLLSMGYDLVFISNCTITYMEKHREFFHLERYFQAFYTAEAFDYMSKVDILSMVMAKHGSPIAIIGDRLKDIEAGRENGIKTIGCSFGYGSEMELRHADYVIEDIASLIEVIEKLE